jgi:hypothetical protein
MLPMAAVPTLLFLGPCTRSVGGRVKSIPFPGAFARPVPERSADGVAPRRRLGIGGVGCRQASQHTYRAPEPVDRAPTERDGILAVHRDEQRDVDHHPCDADGS